MPLTTPGDDRGPARRRQRTRPEVDGAPARLSDVAALAKVSTATASRALSGEPTISAPTRRRVERAAARLAYHVNPMARALSLRRTFTIGLVVGDLTNPFYAQLARGVEAGLHDTPYACFIADLGGVATRQRETVERLVKRHVDGVLVTSPHDPLVVASAGVPVVAIDRCDDVPYVSCDNVAGGRLAAGHLLERGYRRPGVLYAEPGLSPVRDRRAGFAEVLAAAGHPAGALQETRCASLGYDDAYAGALDLLRSGVDSVFCIDDVMAAAVIAATIELGLAVPGDIGVVGYDDTPMAAWRTLNLTSVDQRTLDLGEAAAAAILRCIDDPAASRDAVVLTPRLVVRGSSSGPRKAAKRPRRRASAVRV